MRSYTRVQENMRSYRRELYGAVGALLAVACLLTAGSFRGGSGGGRVYVSPSALGALRRPAPAALTSRHVFIDVGGNVGDSVAAFLTVGVPGVARAGRDFDIVFVFEPNPQFATRYERYKGKQYAFQFIPAAATAHNGTLHFAGEGLSGATSVGSAGGSGAMVASIDFSAWLQQTVAPEDFVVCKIDAEGSEYAIVQRMIADGTLCLCDRLGIEWHAWLGSRATGNLHVRGFNNPEETTERFDEGCSGEDCFCSIPNRENVPFFFCGLPFTTKWLRTGCVPEGAPALEHHERWKGWEHVGNSDAFDHYTTT